MSADDDTGPPPPGHGSDASVVVVPGRRQRLADQLYGQILEHIVSGRLREGDRLPSEKELCEMFGASRPIVREALMRLRADGLVQPRQGAGTFVLSRPAERLAEYASLPDVAGFLRGLEVRLPLEGAAARFAAERRSEAQLALIVEAHEAFRRTIESGGLGVEDDIAFHAAVAEASGNDLFPTILESLKGVLVGFMTLSLNLTRTGSKERAARVLQEHAQILEAIRGRDGEGASLAMRFHIGQARRRMTDRTRDP